jgi:pyridinium-3,5-biscarboxylic acid mononucleotide synthase
MKDFEIDWERKGRTGIAEAIFCEHKSVSQIASILDFSDGRAMLFTRLSPDKLRALPERQQTLIDYDAESRTAFSGQVAAPTRKGIGVVCAGTSDVPVAKEVVRCLQFNGYDAPLIADVGVAGLWRLMRRLEDIRRFDVVIALAGMEGALFSVLAGLLSAPVIAVPVSVGYGVAAGGHAALSSALASCAPGLTTVNIDNGFGGACAAIKMMQIGSNAHFSQG